MTVRLTSVESQSSKGPGSVFSCFLQEEDGIRDESVTGVQTCALPISGVAAVSAAAAPCGVTSFTGMAPRGSLKNGRCAAAGVPEFFNGLLGGSDEGRGGLGVAFDRLDEVLVDAEDLVDLGLDLL